MKKWEFMVAMKGMELVASSIEPNDDLIKMIADLARELFCIARDLYGQDWLRDVVSDQFMSLIEAQYDIKGFI